MKLLDYIRGLRKGKEAHRLEKSRCKTLSWPMLWMDTTRWREITNNGSRNCGCRFLLIRQKKKEHLCYHLEHRCVSDYRIRYQQLFPVPEKRA